MAGKERLTSDNNYPPIPLLSLGLQRIHEADPTAIPEARKIAKNLNAQLINNYTAHKIEGLAKIPYSHLSTDHLPDGVFGQKDPEKEHIHVFFPGAGGNLTDHMHTAFDIMTDNIAQSKKQPMPSTKFYFIGHPTGPGGEISQQWLDGLDSKGLQQNHEANIDLLRRILPQDTENKHISYHGISMGVHAATHVDKNLTEWHGKNALHLKNPAGSHKPDDAHLGERLQLVVGYGIENAIRRVRQFAQNVRDLSEQDKEFLANIAPTLQEKGIQLEDSYEQKEFKRKARIKELLLLAQKPTLPQSDTPTIIERGVWDLISFSPKDAIQYMQGKTTTVNNNISYRLTSNNHSPKPYPNQMIQRMISRLKNI